MKKSIFLGLVIAAIAVTTTSSAIPMSFADQPDDPNNFGDEASDLAQFDGADQGTGDHPGGEHGSEMGEHSRESDATPNEPGRLGIGNLPGHPSESIKNLCDGPNGPCPEGVSD